MLIRPFKFKAWDQENNLMVRLNQIECKKGLLIKQNHILLQFTGFLDQAETELYENDIVLKGQHKYMICWDPKEGSWYWQSMANNKEKISTKSFNLNEVVKLCNYYEATDLG